MLLLWPGTRYGGTLYLGPKKDPSVDQFLFSGDREWRKPHPELNDYIDYNWYTLRIVTPLRNLGLGAGVNWKEH